jgi:hypothetical protein
MLKLNRNAGMKTYVLYIHDDRYTVPTMDWVTASGDESARQLAGERLAASPHYSVVELWMADQLVARLEKPGAPEVA